MGAWRESMVVQPWVCGGRELVATGMGRSERGSLADMASRRGGPSPGEDRHGAGTGSGIVSGQLTVPSTRS